MVLLARNGNVRFERITDVRLARFVEASPAMSCIYALTGGELDRLEIIKRIDRKELTQTRAADLLSLSVRHVRRLLRAFQASGPSGLISKRRGKPSNRALHRLRLTR